MTYVYTLTNDDLRNMGITPTNADEYSINQSGWFGTFYKMYEWFNHEYINGHTGKPFQGIRRGNVIIDGKELTGEQIEYIFKNCKCEEYDN